MKPFVTYTAADYAVNLRLTAERSVELETKLENTAISSIIVELDRLGVSAKVIACAIPEGDYESRYKRALAIYDEMLESGKNFNDYQFLAMDVLVAAGFLKGESVELLRKASEKQGTLLSGMKEKML